MTQRRCFTEFGHGAPRSQLHVMYPSLSGTRVSRDYVEFPSQLMEHWLPRRRCCSASQFTTRPAARSAGAGGSLKKSRTFTRGSLPWEYLAAALVDMKLHLAGGRKLTLTLLKRRRLAELGMPKEIVMRHRLPQFLHVFSSDSYSAGYYSYLWADVLTTLMRMEVRRSRWSYDRKLPRACASTFIFGRQHDRSGEGYRAFRGRDARWTH